MVRLPGGGGMGDLIMSHDILLFTPCGWGWGGNLAVVGWLPQDLRQAGGGM
jgi:hypothetical protein